MQLKGGVSTSTPSTTAGKLRSVRKIRCDVSLLFTRWQGSINFWSYRRKTCAIGDDGHWQDAVARCRSNRRKCQGNQTGHRIKNHARDLRQPTQGHEVLSGGVGEEAKAPREVRAIAGVHFYRHFHVICCQQRSRWPFRTQRDEPVPRWRKG